MATRDHEIPFGASNAQALFQRALRLHRQGQLGDARALYEQVVRVQRSHADAQHLLGVCLHSLGDFPAAERHIRTALRLAPAAATMHLNYGNVLRELGQLPEAIRSYERASRLNPELCLAHFNLGTVWEESGQTLKALSEYERAIALDANYPNAHAGRGNCLLALERTEVALAAYETALALDPDLVNARANLAVALDRLGRKSDALEHARHVLARVPAHPGANRLFLSWIQEQGRPDEWLSSIERLRASAPHDVDLMVLQAQGLSAMNRLAEAALVLEQVLTRDPQRVDALGNLIWHRAALGDAEAALTLCEQVPRPLEDTGEIRFAKAISYFFLGNYSKARDWLNRVLDVNPNATSARFQGAVIDLMHGDYEAGWPGYEYRFGKGTGRLTARGFASTRAEGVVDWRGEEDLREKTLLVYGEQGLGDAVQFCRYVPCLRQMAAKIVLEVPTPAFALVRRHMPQGIEVVPHGSALLPVDAVCPLGSLPLVFGTRTDTIPSSMPYLSAEEARTNLWERRLGPARGRRIGLAWSGSVFHINDAQRSIALRALRGLLEVDGVEFIALQNSVREQDREALAAARSLRYVGATIQDLEDTAALTSLCDLVISVDTSTVHVAGALGKPVWVLLPFVPDWRWMLHREDSPWYPSAKLFRQTQRGRWDDVLDRVVGNLQKSFGGTQ